MIVPSILMGFWRGHLTDQKASSKSRKSINQNVHGGFEIMRCKSSCREYKTTSQGGISCHHMACCHTNRELRQRKFLLDQKLGFLGAKYIWSPFLLLLSTWFPPSPSFLPYLKEKMTLKVDFGYHVILAYKWTVIMISYNHPIKRKKKIIIYYI